MPSFIDENKQWFGANGELLVGASLHIGEQGLDPTLLANKITIYSNRGLSIPLANPVTLDSKGQAPSKIWIPGRYAYQINDVSDVMQDQDLDAGEDALPVEVALSNVAGTNVITAEGSPTVVAYQDRQIFRFKTVSENTGSITANIDGVGAAPVYRDKNNEIVAGQWKANQLVEIAYNSTSNAFEWLNQTFSTTHWYKGADLVSGSTITPGADGNYFDVTGTNTITAIAAASVGTVIRLHFDAILTLTHNATNLILPGAANIVTRAGDEATFLRYESGWRCTNFTRADGRTVIETPAVDKFHWPTLANNSTDAANDMDFLAGDILDITGTRLIELTSTITKQLDVDWAEGNNAGGHPSGAAAPALNETWHCFLIMKDDGTVDAGFDTALDAANLLTDATGYIFYRRIHSFILTTAGAWRAFAQRGDYIDVGNVTLLNAAAFGGSAATSVNFTALVPQATGLQLGVDLNVRVQHNISADTGSWCWGSTEDGAVAAPSNIHPTFALPGLGSGLSNGSRQTIINSTRTFTVDSSITTVASNARCFASAVLHGYYDQRVI